MDKKEPRAFGFLLLGLCAFAGFGLELILSLIEPGIYGVPASAYGTMQFSMHSALTSVLWGAMTVILVALSKKQYGFVLLDNRKNPGFKRLAYMVALAGVVILLTSFLWGGFKPAKEYAAVGLTQFIFQYIYYFFECALILLTIAFGQKFGEMVAKNEKLPYGGIFLAFTWGLLHAFTQGWLGGLYAFVMSLIYGIIYTALRKNTRYAYIFIATVFIL